MNTQIFINLPVKDLEASKTFWTSLGYNINEKFSNNDGACVVISDIIHIMILREPFFKTFMSKEITDTSNAVEVINCFSAESREAVRELVGKALAAGGSWVNEPEELGFMYSENFQDLDGHLWNIVYMDEEAAAKGAMEKIAQQ